MATNHSVGDLGNRGASKVATGRGMIHVPKPQTLKKYGLSEREWLDIYYSQDEKCAICKNPLENKRCNTDHFHVQGYKRMSPEKKRMYVRGILCWTCNKLIVGRGVTIIRLRAATEYMEEFEKRKPK